MTAFAKPEITSFMTS